MNVQIRTGTADDIPAVLRIQSESPEAVPWPADGYTLLLNQGRRLLIATPESESAIAGFLLYQELPEGDAEVLNLAVDPSLRRRGLATGLLQRLIDERPGAILLEVRETNARARNLYAKLGFQIAGRRKGYYHRPVGDALVLRRP